MGRLTSIQEIEHADGTNHEQVYCFGHLWGPAFFKKGTKDYEEYLAIVKRLAEYEDLEEQGKLLKLPVAVGDTVYVKMQSGRYAEAEVRDFTYFLTCGFCIVVTSKSFDKQNIPFSEFGKTVFLTKEEAEAALKEMSE